MWAGGGLGDWLGGPFFIQIQILYGNWPACGGLKFPVHIYVDIYHTHIYIYIYTRLDRGG